MAGTAIGPSLLPAGDWKSWQPFQAAPCAHPCSSAWSLSQAPRRPLRCLIYAASEFETPPLLPAERAGITRKERSQRVLLEELSAGQAKYRVGAAPKFLQSLLVCVPYCSPRSNHYAPCSTQCTPAEQLAHAKCKGDRRAVFPVPASITQLWRQELRAGSAECTVELPWWQFG